MTLQYYGGVLICSMFFHVDNCLRLLNLTSAYFPLASRGFRLTPHRLLSRSVSYEIPAAAIVASYQFCSEEQKYHGVSDS